MASNSETGHAVNIANFKTMIDYCVSFGAKYQPSNPDLVLATITPQWSGANEAHTTLSTALITAKTPIAERKTLFEPLDKLVTRTLGVYKSTKADKQLKSNAKTIGDRIRGAVKVKKEDNPNDVSVSHQSYVQKQDALQQLINLYKSDGNYAPNEAELKVGELQKLSDKMKGLNDNIGSILAPVKNALIKRDELLYKDDTGMVDVAMNVKEYVKGVYGATAGETKMVRGLKFTKPKKK